MDYVSIVVRQATIVEDAPSREPKLTDNMFLNDMWQPPEDPKA